jgi:hypothetical protein
MAKNKQKRSFFQQARTPGWYQGMTTEQAERALDRPEGVRGTLHHIGGEQRAALGGVLSAPDSYNLVHDLARRSEGARTELAERMVDHLLDGGPEMMGRFRTLTAVRLQSWISEITHKDDDPQQEQLRANADRWFEAPYPATSEEALEEKLQFARMIKFRHHRLEATGGMSDWQSRMEEHVRRNLDSTIVVGETLLDLNRNLGNMHELDARNRAARSLADRMVPDMLVRTVDDLNPHYGGSYDPYDGLTRGEVRLHINAADIAMRHWGEINAEGRFDGGLSLANGKTRFLPAETVEKVGTPIPDREALTAALAKPGETAKIIPFRKPGGP